MSEAWTEAEQIARAFHDAYESLAPHFNYTTRDESARPWDQVPEANRRLMIGVVTLLLGKGVIRSGEQPRVEDLRCNFGYLPGYERCQLPPGHEGPHHQEQRVWNPGDGYPLPPIEPRVETGEDQ